MIKVSNGIVNEAAIEAVLKIGANHEVFLVSGQRFTVSPADALLLAGEKPLAEKPPKTA